MKRLLQLGFVLCVTVCNIVVLSCSAMPSLNAPTATAIAKPARVEPPPINRPTETLAAPKPALNRPAQPQIGLNFIRFYWSNRAGALDTKTPYLQPDTIFADFKDLGAQTFRQFIFADLLWDVVEPKDNQWNFTAQDAVIPNANFEPIVTLFRLQYASPTPPWATSRAQFQKTMGPEATDYVETVVKRYAPYVKYWEIGNETDFMRGTPPEGKNPPGAEKVPPWMPAEGFSPRDQGVFFAQAAALIRKNDPDAVILMPGMSSLEDYVLETWLPGVIEGGGKDWFDIVNYHYYSSWERYFLLRPKLTEKMKQLGIANKPVWMTETGATSDPTLTIRTNYPNSAEAQAAEIFRRIVQAWGHGDALVQWHTYISSGDEDGNWKAYGIRTDRAETKPALAAFKLLTHELVPFARVEKIAADARGANAYRITTQSSSVKYVAWGSGSYTLPTGVTQITSVIPKADGSFAWQAAQPGKAISLSASPVLIK